MKELAASVASKVFYYLDETEDALRLALEAGNHFNIREETQYVRTLLNTSID
jgi:26S proteasome regulatory subunit N2